MMSRFFIVIAILLSALIASCSQTASTPVFPADSPTTGVQASATQPLNHYLWLFNEVTIDPETLEYEITPVRTAEGHWNVLSWLEQGPCFDCFGLAGITPLPGGTLEINVRISHPFPIANFTGFDVRGIAMFEGAHTFAESGLIMPDRDAGTGELVNPDGYTTLYGPGTEGSGPAGFQGYLSGKFEGVTPTATLNGYIRHISDDAANTRNAFYAGEEIISVYEVDMPDGLFSFGYAVDACWAKPTTKPVTDPMIDFGPEASCPEPWGIEVTEIPVDAGLTTLGGSTELQIDVFDWQGKTSHDAPVIECEDVFSGILTADFDSDGTDYTRYTVTIDNEEMPEVGIYRCLISVEDEENATAPEWLDLTAYMVVFLEVTLAENQPPTAIAEANSYSVNTGQNILFNDLSTDPDGEDDIEQWAWDFDYDGSFSPSGSDKFMIHAYANPGTYEVMLQIRDSVGHEDFLDTPLEITVNFLNQPPTAKGTVNDNSPAVGQSVQFTDTSTDPDGPADIVQWEWDFSYSQFDGFNIESADPDPTWSYSTPGNYDVLLRVKDTADNLDWMDNPIGMTVG